MSAVETVQSRMRKVRKDSTARRYVAAVNVYARWCEAEGIDIWQVTQLDVEDYLLSLSRERDYGYNTVSVHRSALVAFYDTAIKLSENGSDVPAVEDNPVEDLAMGDLDIHNQSKKDAAHEENGHRKALSKEQVEKLATAVPSPSVRNELLVRLMYQGMLRRGEAARLRLSAIDRENRRITIRASDEKTSTGRTVYYQPSLDGLMTIWVEADRKSYIGSGDSPYLFVSKKGNKLSDERITNIVAEAAENAGLQEVLYESAVGRKIRKVAGHTLRHSGAVRRWNNSCDLRTLQKLLGHKDIKTTQKYLDVSKEELEAKARATW